MQRTSAQVGLTVTVSRRSCIASTLVAVAAVSLLLCGRSTLAIGDDAAMAGWQGMRVIKLEGAPDALEAADLDGDGREELVVVNRRLARLETYRWLPPSERSEPIAFDPERPNDLPMAPDWRRDEIPLDELPAAVVIDDVDGDGHKELILLVSPASKVLMFAQDDEGHWDQQRQWNLLPGSASGIPEAMLRRRLANGHIQLLISFEQGVQLLELEADARAVWMRPREASRRRDWNLVDLDGDGDRDLVEWLADTKQTIRWFEARDDAFLPAQVLHDRGVDGAVTIPVPVPGGAGEVLLLGGTQEALLRRYELGRGEASPLGRERALPLPAATTTDRWTGFVREGRPALAALDPSQPLLRVHTLGPDGWEGEESYPIPSDVLAVAGVAAEPGTLLLWTKDAADLHVSRWEHGRMSYPRSMPQAADVADRAILALGRVGETTWWTQRVGADIVDLYVWHADESQPQSTRFEGVGSNTRNAVWLGDDLLLVQQAYSTAGKLMRLVDGETRIEEPSHLKKINFAEFRLYECDGRLCPARLVDGVLQWLDDHLQPTDQVMLPDGQRLAAFVPRADGGAWALQQGGKFIHRLEPDEGGILRSVEMFKTPASEDLVHDEAVGLLLVDQNRVIRISRGRPWELHLLESIDGRKGRSNGVKEPTIHRILVADVSGDGRSEVLLADDVAHELTVLKERDGHLVPVLSWNVFEDGAYPYGGGFLGDDDARVSEPRVVVGFDGDGDSKQDLAMLCHDRLLIYMAKE